MAQPMAPTAPGAAPEDEAVGAPEGADDSATGGEDDDSGSTIIELEIKQDGTMSVSLEPGDDESQESQETPAKNIDDACRIIKLIAKQVMGGASTADQNTENQAYQQEMAQP